METFLYYLPALILLAFFLGAFITKHIIREAIKEAFEEMGFYKRK